MLEQEKILKHIDELLYLITDVEGNTIYPLTEQEMNEFQDIMKNKQEDSIIYNCETQKWYQYYKKNIVSNDQTYYLEYLIDITDVKEKEKKYQIDTLTRVYTRANILNQISTELKDCYQKRIPFSIIIGDIDYFKEVNDTYGHIAGDEVLKQLGNIFLHHTTKNTEIVGRYGGEEFLFFLKDETQYGTIDKIKKIQEELKDLNISYKNNIISDITMSFGMYHTNVLQEKQITEQDINAILSELIYNADTALYASKNSGRDQTHIFCDNGTVQKVNT